MALTYTAFPMAHSSFSESVVEDASLAWLEGLVYAVLHDSEIAAGTLAILESRHLSRQLGAIPLLRSQHGSRHRVTIAPSAGQARVGNPIRAMWPRSANSYSVARVPAYYRLIAGAFLVLGCTPL